MKTDLLKDITRVRDRIGAECGYDLGRLGVLVRQEEGKAGKRLIRTLKPSQRRPQRGVEARTS